jgi:ssDNA-binding Zn-finger/Zn-ribbon topoisomerase 1
MATLVTLVSIGAGIAVFGHFYNLHQKRQKEISAAGEAIREIETAAATERLKAKAEKDGIACPKCGFSVRLRVARRGRRKGQSFMGCSRYPTCDGTRPLTEK